jgi:hypothetical protein
LVLVLGALKQIDAGVLNIGYPKSVRLATRIAGNWR